MDAHAFDALARALHATPTRRLTVRALTVIGLSALLGPAAATARIKRGDGKHKDKKDKKKKRCNNHAPRFCPGVGCCAGARSQCCPGTCALPSDTCCSREQGGHSCPVDRPQCCSGGRCVPDGAICCQSGNGGACSADVPVCCPAGTGPQVGPSKGCCQVEPDGRPWTCCPAESNACAPPGGVCCTAAQGGGACGPGDRCDAINGCVPI